MKLESLVVTELNNLGWLITYEDGNFEMGGMPLIQKGQVRRD